MSIDLSQLRSSVGTTRDRRPWHGAAFIVESLVLLVFLVGSLAVLMQVMGDAHERSTDADRLSNAVILASNDAEAFAADPLSGDQVTVFALVDETLVADPGQSSENSDRYIVTRTVRESAEKAGTLFEAHIEVTSGDALVYEVDTARYMSDEGVQR